MPKNKTLEKELQVAIGNNQKRLIILRELKGLWKNRKPDPIKELIKIRKEWKR